MNWFCVIVSALLTAGAPLVLADIPNASFEQANGNTPSNWSLSAQPGEWVAAGHEGKHCVSVTGSGDTSNFWRCNDAVFEPSKTYRLSFYTRCAPGTTGQIISGPSFANRDLTVSDAWERKSFVFTAPSIVPSNAFFRLGQWNVKGTVFFDDVEMHAVLPAYAHSAGVELGAGESVRDGLYACRPQLAGDGGNASRALASHTASFNSNRWVFGADSFVVYRHQAGSQTQRKGQVNVSVGYYQAGTCVIEMSLDALHWTKAGELKGTGEKTIELPSAFFPAAQTFIRLRAEKGDDGRQPYFQVNSYAYEAPLMGRIPDVRGETHFIELLQPAGSVGVTCDSLGTPLPGGEHDTTWRLRNDTSDAIKARATLELWRGETRISVSNKTLKLYPNLADTIELAYNVRDAGRHEMRLTVRDLGHDKDLFTARVPFEVPQLFASDYGWRISEEKSRVGVWWCESARKVGRYRAEPSGDVRGLILISAAKNERESFQLVLSPHKQVEKIGVTVTDLRGPDGAKIPSSNVEICRVGYVRVDTPTDATGVADEWPDPLPPLKPGESFTPEIGRNSPLWFTVAVPEGTPAGDYTGKIMLQAHSRTKYDRNAWQLVVPLRVHVWNFSLPKETHLKTAFGAGLNSVRKYHNLTDNDQLAGVWEKYMRNFAEHRIASYWPMALAPIEITFDKSSTPVRVKLDFTKFDAAAKHYLDEMGFNTFRLPLEGLGHGGQGSPHHLGKFGGFEQGTSEYEALWSDYVRQLSDHLEQNGWLRKAYLYWYDEPERSDYGFVRSNNEQIKRLAPKLTRMLTEEPGPELAGAVDVWCPVTPNYRADLCHERQRAGDHVWWYICCSPQAPYCTEFIDHSAVELRTWLWQTWGYGVEGILIWETLFWNQSAHKAATSRQNPWEDPMSYSPTGHWGNGDGRFLYPPNRKNDLVEKFLDGPINSMRWEMLRDGVEDYEYFALLSDLLKKHPGFAEYESLLKVPADVYSDMTHFNPDPTPLLQHRERVARAIERLSRR